MVVLALHNRIWLIFTDQDITTHTMVYYDQRGDGKTLLKNKTLKTGTTLPLMIEDLHQIIKYIKKKYKKIR